MNVLLSRNLNENHSYFHKVKEKGINLTGHSFIDFEGVPIKNISAKDFDLVFSYSKNGIKFFNEGLKHLGFSSINEWASHNPSIKFGAIGLTTSQEFNKLNIGCDFVGEGQPDLVTEQLEQWIKNDFQSNCLRVLFLQAENSLQSVEKKLNGNVDLTSLVVYKTIENPISSLGYFDVILATSPSNAAVILRCEPRYKQSKWICIGPSTARFVTHQGVKDVSFPTKPSVDEMVNMMLTQLCL